jgi:hypothetical protein
MKRSLLLLLIVAALLAACNLPGTAPTEIPIPVDEAPDTDIDTSSPPAPVSGNVIDPQGLEYLGAFRLPEGGERPYTFAYGGNAMTFNPDGDPSGASDGFPGSLFITGHDRLPYDELPDGSRVAEIGIPVPSLSRDVNALNRAEYVQELQDVTAGHFTEMEEIVRTGLLYLNTPATGPVIHVAWGQHIEPDPTAATQGWFNADLANPDFQGPWFIESQSWYSVNDYMLEIPADWAGMYAGGRVVGTGRFKDGGWSGMGPVLIAYRPWDENGAPYPPGAQIPATALLRYASSVETDQIEHCLNDYQHPDEWSGGAWLTTSDGRSAVLFAGAKSNGDKYWYGYIDQEAPTTPCVDTDVTDFLTCRLRDGTPCPPEDFDGCANHNENRGWWSTRWDTQFLFYDPADLARVAAGELASWEPQPYAVLDIDEVMYFNPSGVEPSMIGSGDQRRYRIGDVAYDRQNGLLYVLELYADEAAPVVHVWRVR